MERWYVLETKRHAESRAAHALAQQLGVEIYAPRTKIWPAPPVGGAIAPVFPGYLFARLDLERDSYRALYTPGVKRFVNDAGGAPAALADEIIDGLRARQDGDGFVECGPPTMAGRRMKITSGPFKDFCGILDRRVSGRERAILLVGLLQREVRVEVPEAWLTTT